MIQRVRVWEVSERYYAKEFFLKVHSLKIIWLKLWLMTISEEKKIFENVGNVNSCPVDFTFDIERSFAIGRLKCLDVLCYQLCPYPSDESLQESLQVSVDWLAHRKCELSSTINHLPRDASLASSITAWKKLLVLQMWQLRFIFINWIWLKFIHLHTGSTICALSIHLHTGSTICALSSYTWHETKTAKGESLFEHQLLHFKIVVHKSFFSLF